MKETGKTSNLLSYINNPMSNESINVLYSANNIRFEKCELYNEFVQSLMLLIFDTYMGDEYTDKPQQINHFKWCWNKNIENFNKEGLNFTDSKLQQYFLEFMFEVYYPLSKKSENEVTHKNILKLWSYIFDFKAPKTNSDIDTLIEVYRLFENSLNKNSVI